MKLYLMIFFLICLIKNAVSCTYNDQSLNNSEGENRREGPSQPLQQVFEDLVHIFCPLMQVKIDDTSNFFSQCTKK